jgi:glycosyltransferase involved in cell wall biosynthesis
VKPGVSCIVPVFNGERFIAEALASIAEQEYGPLEIIVVDDGSTDCTHDVVMNSGIQVRYLRQNNAGGPTARNTGIKAATAEFIAFLDADDRWHREKLARQMARFTSRVELDASVAHAQNFWMTEVAAEQGAVAADRRSGAVPGYVAGTLVTRRRFFNELGMFNETLRHGEQMEWFLRARQAGAVIELLPDVLLHRRLHGDNVSRHTAEASRSQYLELLKAALDRRRLGSVPVDESRV